MHGRIHLTAMALPLLLLATGCAPDQPPPPDPPDPPASDAASLFDPATAGTISGQVVWAGDLPDVPPFTHRLGVWNDDPARQGPLRRNPNAPSIDPATHGVRDAVIFLRGVDPRRARPWDQPPVRVEFRDYQLLVRQGETVGRCGFVRRGDPVEMTSAQPVLHGLHARGAAFFALMFPDPDQPRSRRLERAGVVELSSGVGHFWMRGYLFVDDHPYCTRTDAAGRFTLPRVPPGDYEVVCWLPNWIVDHHERDPESGLVSRVVFGPAVEVTQAVALGKSAAATVRLVAMEKAFGGASQPQSPPTQRARSQR